MLSILTVLLFVSLSFSAQDYTFIDNFQETTGKNHLGFSWYYFTDEIEGGSSKILDFTPKVPGDFFPICYDTVDSNGEFCARLSFQLGEPHLTFNDIAYVGVGTDIVPEGKYITFDTSAIIRFRARSIPPITVTFDIESYSTDDNAYYCQELFITEEWSEYCIETSELEQPVWAQDKYTITIVEALEKTYKLNWKIFEAQNSDLDTAGCFFIDDVIIEGINLQKEDKPVTIFNPVMKSTPLSIKHKQPPILFDLLGRQSSGNVYTFSNRTGILLLKKNQTIEKHIQF